jgi:multisubunit Na+/H+ antiporter MnhE subunit
MNIFKDKKGRLAIWQEPNFNIVLFFAFLAVTYIVGHGKLHQLFAALAFGTIFIWSWREISGGDSLFRRLLGLIVMAIALYSRINF